MSAHAFNEYKMNTFICKYCRKNYEARVATWVDVSKSPEVREKIFRWEFNVVRCPHCGHQGLADTPFFYEDFEEGILIKVFPSIPDKPKEVEAKIREQYSYHPFLEFFYDMTQLWVLVYLYFYRIENGNRYTASTREEKETMTKKSIRSIKTDVIMLHIREKIQESFHLISAYDELLNAVERFIYSIEEKGSIKYGTGEA